MHRRITQLAFAHYRPPRHSAVIQQVELEGGQICYVAGQEKLAVGGHGTATDGHEKCPLVAMRSAHFLTDRLSGGSLSPGFDQSASSTSPSATTRSPRCFGAVNGW